MNQDVDYILSQTTTLEDREAILKLIIAHNESKAPNHQYQPLSLVLRHPKTEEILGGIWGSSSYDWMTIELFAVAKSLRGRGIGTMLLNKAEEIARARGCIGIWLDTYDFQAPEFYRRFGYEVFGTIEDYPRGLKRNFMQKRWG